MTVKFVQLLLPGCCRLSGTGLGSLCPAVCFSTSRQTGGRGRAAHRELHGTCTHQSPGQRDRQIQRYTNRQKRVK